MLWIKSGQCVSVGLPATTVLWTVCTVLCMLTAASVAEREEGQPVVVNTRYGALRGARKTIGPNSHVDVFYNIPYAKPPTGDLRFAKPVANEAWTGTRDARTVGPVCPQRVAAFKHSNETYVGQEDCLYVDVYTPKTASGGTPLPVMVWIHGGGYRNDAGNYYNATQLASKGVVVVTVNYRLAALGFLSTQDSVSPGNYGLFDQIRALQWVRDIISVFGGDPHDVTLFGESAGSACVSLLVLSREARGLFTKAIMESGVSMAPWAVGFANAEPEPKKQADKLATRLGCDAGNSRQIVACLRTKNPRSIVDVSGQLDAENAPQLSFLPVAETTFGETGMFSAVPGAILRNGEFNNVTLIRGFNKNERGVGEGFIDPDDDGFTMEEFMNRTRDFVKSWEMFKSNADRIFDLVVETYVTRPGLTNPQQLRDAYIQIMTDSMFIAPTYREQQMYFDANGKTEYLYRFSFRSSHRLNKLWQGVVHLDDLLYVFGYPLTNLRTDDVVPNFVSSWTDDDRRVSERLMTLWTNFAKYGNPTPDGTDGPKWLPWTQATPRYLDLGTRATMVSAPEIPTLRLWNEVIPGLGNGIIG